MGLLYEVGDIVTLKKTHPCGSKYWEILRVGADFRSWCRGRWWRKIPGICRKNHKINDTGKTKIA